MKLLGMEASMPRRGNRWELQRPDGEILGRLKTELVHHKRYATRTRATAAIWEWTEIFYNRPHRHSRLGNVAPAVFARQNFHNEGDAGGAKVDVHSC